MSNYEDLTHAVKERLEFIEAQLLFKGWVARSDLTSHFKIAEAAATRDFKAYKEIAPNNMYLNHTVKRYEVVKELFSPYFIKTTTCYINEIKNNSYGKQGERKLIEPIQKLSSINIEIFAEVSRCINNNNPLKIKYRSMENDLSERVIIPHAFFDTDIRMYVRAFDRKSCEFRDFLLSRIIEVTSVTQEEMKVNHEECSDSDEQWNDCVLLNIVPHPSIENIKNKACIEMDLDMVDGIRTIEVRKRLAPYWLNRWNVDCSKDGVMKGEKYQLYLMNYEILNEVDNAYLAPGFKNS
jgi:hypothetical protein